MGRIFKLRNLMRPVPAAWRAMVPLVSFVPRMSALELKAEMFYTFDRNQEKLAKTEGLLVP